MKLKSSLLYMILENPKTDNRYSKSFQNLKNVLLLEEEEKFQLPHDIIVRFQKLEEKYNSFVSEIPLEVIELYYYRYKEDLNRYIFIQYEKQDLTIKCIELYMILENFFKELYQLTCLVANFYNLEVKINNNSSSSEDIL